MYDKEQEQDQNKKVTRLSGRTENLVKGSVAFPSNLSKKSR